jgi:pyruvate formate lyase activating enzyme
MADVPVELRERTVVGVLERRRDDGRLECTACAHRCALGDGATGLCGVRTRHGGHLAVPFGYIAARRIRPVETNTIFHVAPGADALTFGMYGCDLRCPYCHNASLSQALRTHGRDLQPIDITPEALIDEAQRAGCAVVCSAYNEPMITAEWAFAIFSEARRRGLITALISDGNTTEEALAYLRPVTDVYRVDLKAYSDDRYAVLGGRLRPVLEALVTARCLGYWVEVVTLVVPGFNDDLESLRAMAEHLAEIDRDMPWHLNAFQPRYQWSDRPPQDAALLVSAAGAAYARGLRYVYVGNVPFGELAHTRCPGCHAVVVERRDYRTTTMHLRAGRCRRCDRRLPGVGIE